jgi:hypothetical protein
MSGPPAIVWPQFKCRYVDSHGTECNVIAAKRIHFSTDHPFDHMDLCNQHLIEYQNWVWAQPLTDGRVM